MRQPPLSALEARGASLAVQRYEDAALGGIQQLLDGCPSPTGRKYDAKEMIREHRKDDIYVGELEGKVVGFAIGVFNAWNRTAYLDFILVGMDYLRTGIGTALLEAVMKSAAAKGARLIYTETGEANTGGICFYVHNGFVPTGLIPDYYREGEDAIILVRKLPNRGVVQSFEVGSGRQFL